MIQRLQALLPQPLRIRIQLVLRAFHPQGNLERLLVRRYVVRLVTLGTFRLTRTARLLDERIDTAFRRQTLLTHASWLRLYQPLTAEFQGDAASALPASVLLYPANATLVQLARCLRTLRQQQRPADPVLLIATTLRGRLKARIAMWFAREPSGGVRVIRRPGADLGDVVLWLKAAPILRPRAFEQLTAALQSRPEAEAVYADEDRITFGGLDDPFCKPDFSPVLVLLCHKSPPRIMR